MCHESEAITKGKTMPTRESWWAKVFPALITVLITSGIAFNVYLTKSVNDLLQRVRPLEEWRVDHMQFASDSLKRIAEERDRADDASRERVLREVERSAAIQRESIMAQLAAIQRDVLTIAVTIQAREGKAIYPPPPGNAKKDGDKIVDLLGQ